MSKKTTYIYAFFCAFLTASCNGLFSAKTDRTAKVASTTDFAISNAALAGGAAVVQWNPTKGADSYEIVLSYKLKDGECEEPFVSIRTAEATIKIQSLQKKKMFACVYALNAKGERIKSAANNGYLIGEEDTVSSTLATAQPTVTVTVTTLTSGSVDATTTVGAYTDIVGTASVSGSNTISSAQVSLQDLTSGNCMNNGMTAFDQSCPNYVTAVGTTSWTISIPDAIFTAGQNYQILSKATDSAGHSGTAAAQSLTWLVAGAVPPSATFLAPASNVRVAQGQNASITWTDSDPDSSANIDIYYKSSASGACTSGTNITSGISEDLDGASDTYTWNTAAVPYGTYYICLYLTDGTYNISQWSAYTVNVNQPPTVAFETPQVDDTWAANYAYHIYWAASDVDDPSALLSLYYKTTTGGACNTGTLIASNIDISTTNTYDWTPPAIATYYFCASISDGQNAAVEVWSAKVDTYNQCVWNGITSDDWSVAANWNNCSGAIPTNTDFVLIPASAPNQPYIYGGVADPIGFGPGVGGGTISGVGIWFAPAYVKSDIEFLPGAGIDYVTDLVISNNATLTMKHDAYLDMSSHNPGRSMSVGFANSPGHLVMNGSGYAFANWPKINGEVYVTGPSAARQSSVYLDHAQLNGTYHYQANQGSINFNKNSIVKKFDNVHLHGTGITSGSSWGANLISFEDCSGVTIQDTTWDSIDFYQYVPSQADKLNGGATFGANIGYPAACATPITFTNPTGFAWGPNFEYDPGNLVTWPTAQNCVWTGAQDTNWFNANNWSGCSARTGYPDQVDNVSIPDSITAPTQPVLSANAVIYSISGASSGGMITVNAGANLYFSKRINQISSSVGFKGDTVTCTTCGVEWGQDMTVYNNAELTLGSGITLYASEYWRSLTFGDGATGAKLTTIGGANAAEYPSIYLHGVIGFNGSAGNPAILNINGLNTDSQSNAVDIAVWGYGQIDKFDRFVSTHAYAGFDIFRISSCTGLVVNDIIWTGWEMNGANTAGAFNVNSSCNIGTTVNIFGSGGMYGAAHEIDAGNNFIWN